MKTVIVFSFLSLPQSLIFKNDMNRIHWKKAIQTFLVYWKGENILHACISIEQIKGIVLHIQLIGILQFKKKHRVLNDTKIIILFLYIAVQCYMFWKLLWKAIVYSSFDLITFPRLIASAWLCVWLCPITEYYIDDGEKSGVVRIK